MVRILPGRPAGPLVLPVAVGFVLGSFFSFLTLTHYSAPSTSVFRCHRYLASGLGSCIPPVVHFVQLKKDESSKPHFPFESFLALYSAYVFVQPSAIYIHTDFSPQELAEAAEYGSSWTKKILTAFPGTVRLNQVTAPTRAGDLDIKRIEHRSDFVRLEQLTLHGGIYLDWDVLTVRSVDPLLDSGFKAVVGRQSDATIMNGIIMAARDSAVTHIMRKQAPTAFTGNWVSHSVNLITTVSQAVAGVPREVLIMDAGAFAPFSWTQESVNAALERHEGDAPPAQQLDSLGSRGMAPKANPWAAWERHRAGEKKEWAHDFSDAFFFHNYFNDVKSPRGFTGVSVPYVLARDSNYALAAWPIVMKGIKDGYIDGADSSL
ncbi:putative glycosyl transferase [Diaporthe ampelina]|uniref:Putative glycosyl transferase n=1 Tax=Diaporthe ampelina TaxID=1214573 RepID=A0A0G2FN34_9PEZI|nr:putative glycosyl transferase [Diaporthe ampelina]